MGGGGGGDVTTTGITRSPRQEQAEIKKFNMWDFLGPQSQYNQFGKAQPLLAGAEGGALDFFKGLPGMLAPLSDASSYYEGIIKNRGALSPEGQRDVSQLARLNPGGSLRDVGAFAREALGTESAREARLAGATSQVGQLATQRQGLQTGGLNQLLGVQGGKTSNFTQLQNPILGYLGNLFSGNQQAAIQQNQISATQQAGSQAKMGSTAGGALAAVGSIAAIAL